MSGSKDWVDIAARLREEGVSWVDLPKELQKITGQEYTYDQVRNQVRRSKEGYDERKPKVYKEEDVWTIVSVGRQKRTVKITENDLARLKLLYCLQRLTVNQVCREMNIPRRDFFLVKTAFGITKDDVPYDDEKLINTPTDDLVGNSLQELKKLYFIKLQENEVKFLRKEVNKYYQQDYFIDRIKEAAQENMQDLAKKYKGLEKSKKPETINLEDLMLEVAVVDLHLSKLSWEPEVGESYDYKIAEKRYKFTINDVYERALNVMPGKILVTIGNDFFHTDTIEGTTTAGTPQDFDGRWQKQFNKGTEMLIWTADKFSEIAPVEIILVPGNHDWMVSYYALMLLHAWFKDRDDVNVNTDPKSRKYVEFGRVLIGFTHGDKEKKRIFGNMQVEAPQAWGRTKFREFHLGHLHHEALKEEHGVIVRNLSTMTATDAYHFKHGYVGAIRKSQSFLWHKTKGLTDIWFTTIE